jgi:hypothetical protein
VRSSSRASRDGFLQFSNESFLQSVASVNRSRPARFNHHGRSRG